MQERKIINMKKSKLLFFVIIVLSGYLLNGCYYDNAEELYPGSLNCDVSNLSYDLVIKPIIDSNCAISGCHVSGTGRKDLSTYQGVKDVVDDGRRHFDARVAGHHPVWLEAREHKRFDKFFKRYAVLKTQ